MSGRAEWPGSLVKSLLSMAAQKPSHSRTKLLLEMPPGMAMSLYRSLQGYCAKPVKIWSETMRLLQNLSNLVESCRSRGVAAAYARAHAGPIHP